MPEPGDPQALNQYSYVLNNPLRYNDPSGHCPWCIGAAIGAVVGAVVGAATAAVPQMIQNVRDGRPLTANIDPGEVGKAAVAGAVAGAVVGGTLGWGASALGLVGAGEGGTALVSSATVMEAGATAEAAATAACADGDCTNEITALTNAAKEVVDAACADGDCTNEINTGTNVVYQYVENGVTRYVGITNDFVRRAGEHLRTRGWTIEPIQGLERLSRSDARAVEQVLIEHYGLENLYNRINSIAVGNPIYQGAVQRGTEILKRIGFLEE